MIDSTAIVRRIKQPSAKMPKLYPPPLDDQAIANIAAYFGAMKEPRGKARIPTRDPALSDRE